MRYKIPNYLKFLYVNILSLFLFVTVLRVAFYSFFINKLVIETNDLLQAISFGVRFDLKMAILAFVPVALGYFLSKKFFTKKLAKISYLVYSTLLYLVIVSFYLFDFGHYSYLNLRVNASALRFLENVKISTQVFIESYPIYKGGFLLLVLFFVIIKYHNWLYTKFSKTNFVSEKKNKIIFSIATLFVLAFGVFSSFQHYPLRWSQAFFSSSKELNQFSLNPVLYFVDSFKFRNENYNIDTAKKYAPIINNYLGIKGDTINFERKRSFKINDSLNISKNKPNVVFVMMESVGNASLSYYGNPIKSTPVLDSLMRESISFTNHYVHKATTAGSVFGSITGLPDIDNVKSASRNPMIINQRILFNQFDDYEKLYLLGGSANWANIRAVFQANIQGLTIYEEGSYQEENRADVWGIDDYDLFKEADKIFKKTHDSKKPFVAYLQTATNHMPFTVPDKKGSYEPLNEEDVDKKILKKSGFKSVAQLNALRYLDFNINEFLKRAKKSGYYDNTIFVFFGDHQTAMNPITHFRPSHTKLGLLMHNVPFIIHAPKLVKPQEITKNAHLVDVVPTVMSLIKQDYTNYTLGQNVLDSLKTNTFSFVYRNIKGEPASGIIKDSLYYYKTVYNNKYELINLNNNSLKDISNENPENKELTKEMDDLLSSFYHSTKYLYFNNKK
ncbi:sulfatase-like hydrolase/transferase [Tenacibaculum finnmarkense genomovar ulcerans]|nr:sulfatase-like hydrolase/transferase [Tenacibaculum finnmarkense genomovar ulcerans]MCG8251523.1 sulfatase-like hydrolase/transferase [Tenacibaculum finnmarkense genomovar finnmarkense]